MKYSVKIVLLAFVAAAVLAAQGPQGRGFGGRDEGWRFSFGTVTGAPYSAVQVKSFTQTLGNGNQIQRQEQTKVWRDSQGRVRNESTFGSAASGRAPYTIVMIFDPVAGNMITLDPQKQTAMTRPLKARNSQDFASPRSAERLATPKEDLGTSVINGRQAAGTRTTRTIPAGSIGNQQAITVSHTVWMSPDLKVPLQIVSDDPRFGSSTVNLTNIVQAEPDPALFQIPSGYAVKTAPSGYHGGAPAQSE